MNNSAKYSGILSFVLFTVLTVACTSGLTYYLYQNQELINGFTLWHWLVFSLILTLTSAISITPPTFLAVVMGFFLGWIAFPFLILINVGAIALIYLFYKLLNFSWIENKLKSSEKVQRVLTSIKADELKIIFFTKLSPLFPFAVTNLIFAVSGAKFKNILWGGFLGMIPRTLLAVYVGRQAGELKLLLENPNQGIISQVVVSLLIIVSSLGMFFVLKKAINK